MTQPAPQSSTSRTIVWFRRDLRLADNAALVEAAARGAVIPLYIHAPDEEAPWQPGGAARVWLHHSLADLAANLRAAGAPLVIRRGPSAQVLDDLLKETGADAVYWNRLYDPTTLGRDGAIKESLRGRGVLARSFRASVLFEPPAIASKAGTPFKVFTPYWKHLLTLEEPAPPLPAPRLCSPAGESPEGLDVGDLALLPRLPWGDGTASHWRISEAGARAELDRFLADALTIYHEDRNRPDIAATSRLSTYLHHGNLSPNQAWHAVRDVQPNLQGNDRASAQSFLRELAWREFAHHILYHFPNTPTEPLREQYRDFPWQPDAALLEAWQRGQTGYPIVDAGMRELWATGWMHNRVRMIVASFLCKHLLQPWQEGAAWFWDTLFDADLANNTMGWQWTAGCGADAAPYFRIFNPITQGAKFDPDGVYTRSWVPELARLTNEELFAPWEAGPIRLSAADVRLGKTYPEPIVDHREGRERALEALAKVTAK